MKYISYKHIKQIVNLLNSNGVIALPTDTIYGLSCYMNNIPAISRIYQYKERARDKLPIILLSNLDINFLNISSRLRSFIEYISLHMTITFVVEGYTNLIAFAEYFYVETPTMSIGIRLVRNYSDLLQLLNLCNMPILSTSLNISSQEEINDYLQISQQFPYLDGIVYDLQWKSSQASSVIKIDNDGKFDILRHGNLDKKRFELAIDKYFL